MFNHVVGHIRVNRVHLDFLFKISYNKYLFAKKVFLRWFYQFKFSGIISWKWIRWVIPSFILFSIQSRNPIAYRGNIFLQQLKHFRYIGSRYIAHEAEVVLGWAFRDLNCKTPYLGDFGIFFSRKSRGKIPKNPIPWDQDLFLAKSEIPNQGKSHLCFEETKTDFFLENYQTCKFYIIIEYYL